MYSPEAIKRFKNPKNAGKLKKFNGLGKAGDPDCSDVIEISVLFEKGIVKNAKFKVYGCPGAISTTDAFIDLAKGKTMEQALKISQQEISNLLGGLPLSHMHCSKLPIEAFKDALKDYQNKRR
ncbi:MAG: iron-sulfur cluster assembly scaffold protein [Nanoarchaeota archaeon]|nr:iron-sulfur cluster assembly scaffold protein [Nanoarchaeota archaeon]MBU1005728.1 iron-sulfur cluster assembly scaffold protein [Nanoarchaeota archaeon]MBU1945587.1 iron-sulfur cluster assembly scaffold protein [Nanoarchaeota archaeon]